MQLVVKRKAKHMFLGFGAGPKQPKKTFLFFADWQPNSVLGPQGKPPTVQIVHKIADEIIVRS